MLEFNLNISSIVSVHSCEEQLLESGAGPRSFVLQKHKQHIVYLGLQVGNVDLPFYVAGRSLLVFPQVDHSIKRPGRGVSGRASRYYFRLLRFGGSSQGVHIVSVGFFRSRYGELTRCLFYLGLCESQNNGSNDVLGLDVKHYGVIRQRVESLVYSKYLDINFPLSNRICRSCCYIIVVNFEEVLIDSCLKLEDVFLESYSRVISLHIQFYGEPNVGRSINSEENRQRSSSEGNILDGVNHYVYFLDGYDLNNSIFDWSIHRRNKFPFQFPTDVVSSH